MKIINNLLRCLLVLMLTTIFPSTGLCSASVAPDKQLEKAAQKGDVSAMLELGKWYETQMAADNANTKKAADWYKKAANKGSKESRWRFDLSCESL